jgi:mitogen-activated protein kinase kinase kinase
MTTESRQRSSSNLSSSSDRAARRGPPPPLSTNRNNLSALTSPPNSLLTPLSGSSQYSLLSPGGAARSTSPRGRAHTVADPHLVQTQQSYLQRPNMSFYPPPPPPPQASTPQSHIRLPGPPPRPTTSNQHGGMGMPGPYHWNPPPGQYQQQNYNPSLYPHPSYTPLPPPPVRPPQQQQQAREPLTSATYVPDGASFGPGMYIVTSP